MYITSFQVDNYKSFASSGEMHFRPGFNVIVGQNDAGKTALIEALSLKVAPTPHKSLTTIPTPRSQPDPKHNVYIAFSIEKKELIEIIYENKWQDIYIPIDSQEDVNTQIHKFNSILKNRFQIKSHFQSSDLLSALIPEYGEKPETSPGIQAMAKFRVESSNSIRDTGQKNQAGRGESLPYRLAHILRDRIYMFNAERLNIGESQIGTEQNLHPNASNLPQVLGLSRVLCKWFFLSVHGHTVFIHDHELIDGRGPVQKRPGPSFRQV